MSQACPAIAPTSENRYCGAVIGQRFGNYRALSLLGEGGMGAVYLAEHPEIGRRVAIKVLRAELTKDASLLQRFLNEARAANAIRHPNIIEILDSGTTAEGTPYLVMELLEGEVLSERIQRLGHLPVGEALELAYQAASALSAAHEKGIIHRDLKPDNLFIVGDPDGGARERIKVLDFGIAKLQTFPNASGMQTRTGTLMGTPVYMSPEQCLGTRVVDARSDIYALGVIMFEMLAGRPPFLSEGFGELVNMHLNVQPPSLAQLQPAIPEPVARLVHRALEKKPQARPQSASELQRAILDACENGNVVRGSWSHDLHRGQVGGSTSLGGMSGRGMVDAQESASSRETAGPRAFPGATTLSTGVGEREPDSRASRRRSGSRVALLALAVIGAGLAVVTTLRSRGTQSAAEESTKPAAGSTTAGKEVRREPATWPSASLHTDSVKQSEAPRIGIAIQSQPNGADVTDVDSGKRVGVTPLVLERPADGRPLTIRLQKDGYTPLTRTFSVDRARNETLTLWPTTSPETGRPSGDASRARPGVARPDERPKRNGRPRQVAAPDDEPAKL